MRLNTSALMLMYYQLSHIFYTHTHSHLLAHALLVMRDSKQPVWIRPGFLRGNKLEEICKAEQLFAVPWFSVMFMVENVSDGPTSLFIYLIQLNILSLSLSLARKCELFYHGKAIKRQPVKWPHKAVPIRSV